MVASFPLLLDRPDPLGGRVVEGGVLEDAYRSFVGCRPVPVRYGLTAGEFARMVNEKEKLGCDLQHEGIEPQSHVLDVVHQDIEGVQHMPAQPLPLRAVEAEHRQARGRVRVVPGEGPGGLVAPYAVLGPRTWGGTATPRRRWPSPSWPTRPCSACATTPPRPGPCSPR